MGRGKSIAPAPQAKRKKKKQLSTVEKFEEQRNLFLAATDKDKFIADYLLSLADNKHIVKAYNFEHNYTGIEVDYYSHHSCESYGCDEEGICRCGEIDLDSISFKIKDEKDLKDSLASHFLEQLNVLPNNQEQSEQFFLNGANKIAKHIRNNQIIGDEEILIGYAQYNAKNHGYKPMFNTLSEEQEYEKRAFYSRLLTKSERDRIRNINAADKQAIRNIIDNYDFGEDDFYALVGGDFYGESIDGVYLLKDTQDSIQQDIETYLFTFSKV